MSAMVFVALGTGLAGAILAIIELLLAYPRLPASVPLHFDIKGRPGRWGSRGLFIAVFGTLIVLLAAAMLDAAVMNAEATGVLAVALCFVAFVEHLIIAAARRPRNCLALRPFWLGFAIFLLALMTWSALNR